MKPSNPLILLILDGWGVREPAPDNAISSADTPNWDRLWSTCPHVLLETSGEAVGLPAGQMGNSEVGHMNLGAGRIVYQELTRIGKAIASSEFSTNPALTAAIEAAKKGNGCLHLMGLLSAGGVHSHEDHLFAMIKMAADADVEQIAVHAFLDGRDTPPRSARSSIERLIEVTEGGAKASIATVTGRYWAMDRDKRYERTAAAWQAIVEAQADHHAEDALAALAAAYARDEDDEFVKPTVIGQGRRIEDGDAVVFINFRADRARQLTQALVAPDFDGFKIERRPRLAEMVTMTLYQDDLPCRVAFKPQTLPNLFGEVVSRAGLRQLRIAETEKYAHVTYFFNGGEEKVFPGESRQLIPSPKVATYDLQPEMSAPALSQALVEAIEGGHYEVIIANVANPDMVGHSGKFEAAVSAVEAVDQLLGQVIAATEKAGGTLLVTADHGNVEQMTDPENNQPHTAHTLNPVPLVYVGPPVEMTGNGSLRDIAPTMLALLGLDVPSDMTGQALVRVSETVTG